MELSLETISPGPICAEGQLGIDGVFECYTLELPYTDGSVGSAIAAGRYRVTFAPSPKFLKLINDRFVADYADAMPHIVGILGRSLIMFHWGNGVYDVEGCIAVGKTRAPNFIGHSREAFADFYEKIREPVLAENCFVTVSR